MIRVGFLISFSDRLLGQLNYFRNLLEAIVSLPERKIEPVIITGQKIDEALFKNFPSVEIVRTRLLNRKKPLWLIHKILQYILPSDILLQSLLKKHGISILSHSGSLGTHSKIKTIGWIPDFQHKHLPDLFKKIELYERDKVHKKLCRGCSCMLVSSYDSLKDLARFYPACADKTKVLQFVAGPAKNLTLPEIKTLENKYNFCGPFFLLPNQFWVHKNHKVVIEALNILKNSGENVLVISTGKTFDHRQPDHFQSLMSIAASYGIAENFRVIGVVPYNELISLMKYSVALINPSLFEGWSSTVEEAKSLGKRIILSDIPIHKEQDPEGAFFFNPSEADTLSAIMLKLQSIHNNAEEQELVRNANNTLLKRKIDFANKYQDIVLELYRSG